jgi:hypothetical protein
MDGRRLISPRTIAAIPNKSPRKKSGVSEKRSDAIPSPNATAAEALVGSLGGGPAWTGCPMLGVSSLVLVTRFYMLSGAEVNLVSRRVSYLVGVTPADVARPDASALTPVGVPVGTVRTAGASGFTALNTLEPEANLPGLRAAGRFRLGRGVVLDEEPAYEDQEAPEVVLVESPDLPDETSLDGQMRSYLELLPKIISAVPSLG